MSGDEFIDAQRVLARDWGFDCYRDALRSWIATVAIVEVGYVGEWEEYAHELVARDYLDEVAHRAPSMKKKIEGDLSVWDERFRAATVQEEKPHLPITDGRIGWWQYRSPKRWRRPASEELAAHDRRVHELITAETEAMTESDTVESVLVRLRERAANPIEAIKVVETLFGLRYPAGKIALSRSPAWSAYVKQSERLHEVAEADFRQLADE
jgi:hypothetical protein